jgi:hypothetical protein
MWNLDVLDIGPLVPAEQIWIAHAVEENGGPDGYVAALRAVANQLGELGWWLAGPPAGTVGGALARGSGHSGRTSSPGSRSIV